MVVAMASTYKRTTCRLCGTYLLPVLSLRPTPPANAFLARPAVLPVHPLDLMLCRDCGNVQLGTVVDPQLLFRDYTYVSGTAPSFVRHLEDYAADLIGRLDLRAGDAVVEIGSNDGTMLRAFRRRGLRVLGLDPATEIARAAAGSGLPTLPEFFTPALVPTILELLGRPPRLVVANNVLAHIDDLDQTVRGIVDLLRQPFGQRAALALEVQYLPDLLAAGAFDLVYHEHLNYHSVRPLARFLGRHGLTHLDVRRQPVHGGSIRVVASIGQSDSCGDCLNERPVTVDDFLALGRSIETTATVLQSRIANIRAAGRRVVGYGAPAKSTTFLHQMGLGAADIAYIVDDSPLKQGRYTPGTLIPITSPDRLVAEPDATHLLALAWNFFGELRERHPRFPWIRPFPTVEVVRPVVRVEPSVTEPR